MIRLSKSCLGDEEAKAVKKVLENEYLGMGSVVKKFEKKLSIYFGRPATCVVNGTAALHLALQASGIGQGDEVLVQSLTYVASFQAISATGAQPVACDVDTETLTIDLQDAEKRLTRRTKAIMPVHYAGGVGDLSAIYEFAQKYKLRVIEDAAHAFGTEYRRKKIGSFGDICCFSFDGIKNITSGEGGCIVTADKNILQKIKNARLLGVINDTEKRYKGLRSWEFQVYMQGWRYHMSNIMAAIGIAQLKKRSFFAQKRKKLALHYDRSLKEINQIKTINHDYKKVVPHIYVVKVNTKKMRDKIKKILERKRIQTGLHWQPCHVLQKYKNLNKPLNKTDKIFNLLLTLPLHPDLTIKNIDYICRLIKQATKKCIN